MSPERSQKRPAIQDVSTPDFIRIFGDISAAKSLAMRELMPALGELVKSIPDTIRLGIEEARKK